MDAERFNQSCDRLGPFNKWRVKHRRFSSDERSQLGRVQLVRIEHHAGGGHSELESDAVKRFIWFLLIGSAVGQLYPYEPPAPTSGGGNHLAFVQACNHNITTSTSTLTINIGTTVICSASSNPVAGHLVFVYFSNLSTGISGACPGVGCADTLANTWTCVYDATNSSGYCYSILTTGGSADTFTATTAFNAGGPVISLELSGANATPLDGSAVFLQVATATSWTMASKTTTNTNDVVIGCLSNVSVSQTSLFTVGSGYTLNSDAKISGGGQSGMCEYKTVTSTGTYAPTASSASSTTMTVNTITLAFKSS